MRTKDCRIFIGFNIWCLCELKSAAFSFQSNSNKKNEFLLETEQKVNKHTHYVVAKLYVTIFLTHS